eukprot:403368807
MESAGSHAYVSKNFLAKYQQKKAKAQTEQVLGKPSASQMKDQAKRRRSRSRSKGRKSRSRSNSGSGSDDEGNERCRSIVMVHSDDLEGALNLSDSEDMSTVNLKRGAMNRNKKAPARIFKQEVDTNVFNICMGTLKNDGELATGDPIFCKGCGASFNLHSIIVDAQSNSGMISSSVLGSKKFKEDDQEEQKKEPVMQIDTGSGYDPAQSGKIWPCEFCNFRNPIDVEPEEMPKSNQVTYILEAAAQVYDKKALGNQDVSVIFCIDISGSMCVTQKIVGKHSIKGDKSVALKDLMKFSDGSDQRLEGEANVTYISRLQCVQAAIDAQLTEMSQGAPNRKVGLVTFNGEVTLIGDATKAPQTIAGDKLFDYDFLVNNGLTEGSSRLQNTISETREKLQHALMSVEETGPTALGPALVTAISMAAQGNSGSTVVLCTDGLANVGLGAFDEIKSDEELRKTDEFYEILGQFAKDKGVTVSIISIAGDECNIDSLSRISEMTGGNVERVDPVQLTQNFSNILQLPVIATNVVTQIRLHKGLEFRNEDVANLSEDKSLLVRDQGNVTEETEFTFEYRLKSIKDLVKMEDIDLTQIKSFPFQAQITYYSLQGSKQVRIITNQQTISNDREDLEKNANYQILSTNAIQQSSKLAKRGQMREAQAIAKTWKRQMRGNVQSEEQAVQYQQFNKHFGEVYDMINEEQVEDADMEEAKMAPGMGKAAGASKKKAGMFGKLGDKISAGLFKASKINKKQLDM